MQTQKYLITFALAVCLSSALGMLFGVWLEFRDFADLALSAGIYLLPLAAALWLSRCVHQPFLGETPLGGYME